MKETANILDYKVATDAIFASLVCENVEYSDWRILTGNEQKIVVAQLLWH